MCGNSFLLTNTYGDNLRRAQYEIRLAKNHAPRNVSGNDMWKLMAAKMLMNSGIFVGDAASLRSFFERVLEVRKTLSKYRGDQILYQILYHRYPELNLVVDTDASICYVYSYLYRPGDVDLLTTRTEGNTTVTECHANEHLTTATPGSKIHYGADTEPIFMHFLENYKSYYEVTCKKPAWTALAETINANTTGIRDFDRGTHVPLPVFCSVPK